MNFVIGIGNDMRGDDGVGPRVVNAIPSRADLETMTVHQLVPELAEMIQHAQRVLFVDASMEGQLRLQQLEASAHRGLGHACSPAGLLGWTKLAYEQVPESWLLSIPGFVFEFGETLSPRTTAYLPEALERIESWLNECPEPVLMMNEEEA
jgi:hydrogenase maturation protease